MLIDGEVGTLAHTELLTSILKTKDAQEYVLEYISGGFEGFASRMSREELLDEMYELEHYSPIQVLNLVQRADDALVKSNKYEWPVGEILRGWEDLEHEVDYGFVAYLMRQESPLKAWDAAKGDIEEAILDALADIASQRGVPHSRSDGQLVLEGPSPMRIYWGDGQLTGEDNPWATIGLTFGEAWAEMYR